MTIEPIAFLAYALYVAMAFSWAALILGLTEEFATPTPEREQDYALAIRIAKGFCLLVVVVNALTTINFGVRFVVGLPGSTQAGPQVGTLFSLSAGLGAFTLYAVAGIGLLALVRHAHKPDEARRARAREVVRRRIQAERAALAERRRGEAV